MAESSSAAADYDVVVIGAGFAGMYAIHKLREHGFSVLAFEAGQTVGGTWYWNRYPGARCDVESLSYSYSFDPELVQQWDWSERFASQPEILRYAQWIAHKLDLHKHIEFDIRVTCAEFDETTATWSVLTSSGNLTRARYLLTAVGCLSAASVPQFSGMDRFAGAIYHTGRWPHEDVDFTGKNVAVIGTGSSGIQVIPEIARQAGQLTVFQRTPNYSLPARNRPLNADEHAYARKNHAMLRERARQCPTGTGIVYGLTGARAMSNRDRDGILDRYWHNGGNVFLTAFHDVGTDLEANNEVAEFVRQRIAMIVDDPAVAERLTPRDYPIGAKRICVDTDYYATFNQAHVDLVDVREEPITSFTEVGLTTTQHRFSFDAIVMATGYDSMTGPLNRIDIRGRGGRSLKEAWEAGPRT
ncbi:flavin-containing monooxygenase, partial [Nocardia sp. NPDC060220]|uniref:flavin-containing monooxygenase n=1 Tax=Nocardia sp. NPDC060220 TaxID=3347076 RepID=UPI003655797A